METELMVCVGEVALLTCNTLFGCCERCVAAISIII